MWYCTPFIDRKLFNIQWCIHFSSSWCETLMLIYLIRSMVSEKSLQWFEWRLKLIHYTQAFPHRYWKTHRRLMLFTIFISCSQHLFTIMSLSYQSSCIMRVNSWNCRVWNVFEHQINDRFYHENCVFSTSIHSLTK